MAYFFRCPTTGLGEFFNSPGEHRCPFCREIHDAHECGLPPKELGAPIIQTFKERYAFEHKTVLTSRKQEEALDRKAGFATITAAEQKEHQPGQDSHTIFSFPKQGNRGRGKPITGAKAKIG